MTCGHRQMSGWSTRSSALGRCLPHAQATPGPAGNGRPTRASPPKPMIDPRILLHREAEVVTVLDGGVHRLVVPIVLASGCGASAH